MRLANIHPEFKALQRLLPLELLEMGNGGKKYTDTLGTQVAHREISITAESAIPSDSTITEDHVIFVVLVPKNFAVTKHGEARYIQHWMKGIIQKALSTRITMEAKENTETAKLSRTHQQSLVEPASFDII